MYTFVQEIYDFLSFKTFISPYMLFIFYYIGAILVPFFAFKYAKKIYKYPQKTIEKIIPIKYKFRISLASISIFLLLEILWRMMFEFLLAYLQIRESLTI